MTDDPTKDLSDRTRHATRMDERRAIGRHHIRQVQAEPVSLAVPRAFNRWVIPGGVVLSALLWVASAALLLRGDLDPVDLVVTLAALFTTGFLGLYVKEYLVHQAAAHDHQLLLDEARLTREEVMALKGMVISMGGELRALMATLGDKVDKTGQTYWAGYTDGATDILDNATAVNATNVFPLAPRTKHRT